MLRSFRKTPQTLWWHPAARWAAYRLPQFDVHWKMQSCRSPCDGMSPQRCMSILICCVRAWYADMLRAGLWRRSRRSRRPTSAVRPLMEGSFCKGSWRMNDDMSRMSSWMCADHCVCADNDDSSVSMLSDSDSEFDEDLLSEFAESFVEEGSEERFGQVCLYLLVYYCIQKCICLWHYVWCTGYRFI